MKSNTILIIIGVVALLGVGGFMIMNSSSPAQPTGTTPSSDTSAMREDSMEEDAMEQDAMDQESPGTIVDIAVANGNFDTLVTAVTEAGLVETLSGQGPFTVFAPTDDAFAKLPEGTIESLLENPEELTKVLTYHVISGEVMAEDVVNLTTAETVQGQEVSIRVEGGNVYINDAQVVQTDIVAENGVIHVIDTVLLPE